MPDCAFLSEIMHASHDLCSLSAEGWAWGLAAAWVASPLFCFACFAVMRSRMMGHWNEPFVLRPAPDKVDPMDGSTADVRVCSVNMCLLPGGWSFSGSWLFDGDDKKEERINMLLVMLEDYDVLLLNEMWGCTWSSFHTRFFRRATESGFYVCATQVGLFMDSGNVIVSRFPLSHATSLAFKSASGWQSLIPNGVLHAVLYPPSGTRVHLFTTHLQCTSAPDKSMHSDPTTDSDDEDTGCLSGVVRALEADHEQEAEQRLAQLDELYRFVHATAGVQGTYIVAGDFNIEGGSKDYEIAARLFGRDSVNALSGFKPTYTTRSPLTPPGWRSVHWEANLDHIFTNLEEIRFFDVIKSEISDHLPMHLVASLPHQAHSQPEMIEDVQCCISIASDRGCSMGLADSKDKKELPKHTAQIAVPLLFADVPLTPQGRICLELINLN